jgi:hypothetical protein
MLPSTRNISCSAPIRATPVSKRPVSIMFRGVQILKQRLHKSLRLSFAKLLFNLCSPIGLQRTSAH